jgi:hypothetical protein
MRREIAFCATRSGTGALARPPAVRHGPALARAIRRIPPLMFSLLLGLTLSSASGLAAPITGETQAEPAAEPAGPLTLQDPAAPAVEPSFGGDADATVIEFSIVPSASDPNKMETIIILQQGGGKKVCVNQNSSDIISRGYRPQGEAPFNPNVPGEIRGLSSGDSGELVGFNDIKVFIRPHSSADEFTDTDECFRVAEVEACFVADGEDCDQELTEGELLCVGDGISSSGCAVADHTNLMRRLRIMVALNQPLGETPIITAADVAAAPGLALPNGDSGEPSGEPPAGPAPAGPTADEPVGGSGGGPNLVTVPDVFGKTLAEATGIITGVGLVVGDVATQDQQAGLLLPSPIRPAHAQGQACEPGTVITQAPPAGTLVPPETPVNLVLCAQAAEIPEPSSLVLFAVGLGLLILFTWSRRRLR